MSAGWLAENMSLSLMSDALSLFVESQSVIGLTVRSFLGWTPMFGGVPFGCPVKSTVPPKKNAEMGRPKMRFGAGKWVLPFHFEGWIPPSRNGLRNKTLKMGGSLSCNWLRYFLCFYMFPC